MSGSVEERLAWHMMMVLDNRVASFRDWPFTDNNSKCTPQRMAEAGFFHSDADQNADSAQCWVCHKELDGWEPTDDPLVEHKKHSKDCPFLALSNRLSLTVGDAMEMTRQRCRLLIIKAKEQKIKELQESAQKAIKQLEKFM